MGQTSLEQRIVDTSLKYGVLSRFTAFVAVDQRVVNEGGTVRRVTQPVDTPSGWEVPTTAPAAAMPAAGARTFGAMARFSAPESHSASHHGSGYGAPMQGGYGSAPGRLPGIQGGPPSAPAPGGMPGAPGSYGSSAPDGGLGGSAPDAPSAPGIPWAPPVAPPPGAKPAPPRPPMPGAGDAVSLARFVADELARLRGNDGQDVWLRAGLLTALSERIRLQLAAWEQANEPADARTKLGALSTELAVPTADPAEVDRRWQNTVAILESLASGGPGRSRRPFWKR
jgi:Ca-activated chloride channel family protein